MTREELDTRRREIGRLSAEIVELDRLLKGIKHTEDDLREAKAKSAEARAEFRKAIRALSDVDLRRFALAEIIRLPGLDAATRRDLRGHYRAADAKRLRHELMTETGLLALAETASGADGRAHAMAESAQRGFEEAHADEIAVGRKVLNSSRMGPLFRRGHYKVPPVRTRTEVARAMRERGLGITSARKYVARNSAKLFGIKASADGRVKPLSFSTVKLHTKGMKPSR